MTLYHGSIEVVELPEIRQPNPLITAVGFTLQLTIFKRNNGQNDVSMKNIELPMLISMTLMLKPLEMAIPSGLILRRRNGLILSIPTATIASLNILMTMFTVLSQMTAYMPNLHYMKPVLSTSRHLYEN